MLKAPESIASELAKASLFSIVISVPASDPFEDLHLDPIARRIGHPGAEVRATARRHHTGYPRQSLAHGLPRGIELLYTQNYSTRCSEVLVVHVSVDHGAAHFTGRLEVDAEHARESLGRIRLGRHRAGVGEEHHNPKCED